MFCLVLIKLEVALKEIVYSVLTWVESGLGTVRISFLVMLLNCGFVAFVSCVGWLSLLL